MSYTIKNLREIEDVAPKFGFSEVQEARFPRKDLESETIGLAFYLVRPGCRQAFAHRHEQAEEIYVVLSGRGRIKLENEIHDVGPMDAIRVAPALARAFEAGPDGLELLVFGPRYETDGEVLRDKFWPEEAGAQASPQPADTVRDLRPELFEHRGHKAEPVAEEARRDRVDLERGAQQCRVGLRQLEPDGPGGLGEGADRGAALAAARVHKQLGALDADLGVGAEERRAEAAERPAQPDLAVRAPARRRDHVRGEHVKRLAGHAERGRRRLQPATGAEPAIGAPGGEVGVLACELVPQHVTGGDGRDEPAAGRNLAPLGRVIGEPGLLVHRGRGRLEDTHFVASAEPVERLLTRTPRYQRPSSRNSCESNSSDAAER